MLLLCKAPFKVILILGFVAYASTQLKRETMPTKKSFERGRERDVFKKEFVFLQKVWSRDFVWMDALIIGHCVEILGISFAIGIDL